MIEVRWHARAGQGAKTASQLLAVALLRTGRSVQAFPEYGPERRGAPLRAYTRFDDRPIRRHDAVEEPHAVVVLEPSLVQAAGVLDGLRPDGLLLVNAPEPPDVDFPGRIVALDAGRSPNLIMVGALAAALGEPPLDDLVAAAVELLGRKVPEAELRAALTTGTEALCPA